MPRMTVLAARTVKDLMKVLKARYPLRVRDFDVDKEADYALFKRIEVNSRSG